MPIETLPRPNNIDDSPSNRGPEMWVDEGIWGHRLHDEQTPWLAFLEFLNVLLSEFRAGQPFQETSGANTLRYRPSKLLHLRNVIFNNPRLAAVLRDEPDDDSRWRRWLADMAHGSDGLTNPTYGYLRDRFSTFEDFAATVRLLRSTSIEGESNKRWSSKFVFPYGPAALYEDLNVKPNSITNDRRFFGRVGELVYLMLARSGKGAELAALLQPLVLNEQSPWNKLIKAFEPAAEEERPQRANAYLPYQMLPGFTRFAEDWIAVLQCRMPGYDAVPHLVDLLGLHVVLYLLQTATDWASPGTPVRLVCEVIAPRRTTIRDLAAETYLENNNRSREAVSEYITQLVERDPAWQAALQSTDPFGDAVHVTERAVAWPDLEKYDAPQTPQALLATLRESAMRRHSGHVANVHGRYAQAVGLASKRGSRRLRYAPSDQLLATLVLATVPRRMEFQRFLSTLYDRYGLLIGHRQAGDYIARGLSDQKSFEDNARRLELRLASLGLLRRLSDACAYVENPFTGGDR